MGTEPDNQAGYNGVMPNRKCKIKIKLKKIKKGIKYFKLHPIYNTSKTNYLKKQVITFEEAYGRRKGYLINQGQQGSCSIFKEE